MDDQKKIFIVSKMSDIEKYRNMGLVYVIGDLVLEADYTDKRVLLCRICCKTHGCDKNRIDHAVSLFTIYKLWRRGYKVYLGDLEPDKKKEIIKELEQFGIRISL